MAGPIWSTLLSNIQGRLRDDNARTWSAAVLLRIANAAQRSIAMRGWDIDKALFLKAHEITSEADREVYDLPRDFGRLQWFERGDLGDSYRPHLRVIEPDEAEQYRYGTIFAQWYDAHPQDARRAEEVLWLLGNDRVGVTPIPTVATRIYRCWYLHLPVEMQGTKDPLALPRSFQNAFELEVCVRAKREAQEDYAYLADELAQEWGVVRRGGDRRADEEVVVQPARIF